MPPLSFGYLWVSFLVGSLFPSMGVCTCLPSVIQKLPLSATLRPVQGVGIPPREIMKFYQQDKIYSKMLENPKAHVRFGIKQGLIFTKKNLSRDVICISSKAIHKWKWLIKIIINHAHNIIGHFGQFKTAQYIRRYFWWLSMSHDIELYCRTCSICATTKDTNSKLAGLLHSLLIPDRPWQSIGMDFMGPLLKLNNFNYLLVVIDWLMSQVHLVLTTTTVTTRGVTWLILKEVVRLHGIPESIVSDRDTKFTSIF